MTAVGAAVADLPPQKAGHQKAEPGDRVSAPVVYEGLMLVIASDQGVAAVVFTDKLPDGRAYKFRYESNDGKTKEAGKGKVFEKYKRVPGRTRKKSTLSTTAAN